MNTKEAWDVVTYVIILGACGCGFLFALFYYLASKKEKKNEKSNSKD